MKLFLKFGITLLLSFSFLFAKAQKKDYLLRVQTDESCKYVDKKGRTIIAADKYLMCFTDTFRTFALVLDEDLGFVGIDRIENVLYKMFVYDNGPDYFSEGLFRIVLNNRIGYADAQTGKVVIEPTFHAAYPFENGKAKVAYRAKTISEGEHFRWESNEWFYIDKFGRKLY